MIILYCVLTLLQLRNLLIQYKNDGKTFSMQTNSVYNNYMSLMTSVIYESSHYFKPHLPDIRYINEFTLTVGQLPQDQHHGSLQSVFAAASVHGHGRPCRGKVTLSNLD